MQTRTNASELLLYADSTLVAIAISAMPDEPSKMIRVPTPLIEAVKELSRLHRQGRTKAVLEGVEKLIAAIDIDLISIAIALQSRYQSSLNGWSN